MRAVCRGEKNVSAYKKSPRHQCKRLQELKKVKALTFFLEHVSAYKNCKKCKRLQKKKKKKKTFPFYYSTYKNKSQALLKKEL